MTIVENFHKLNEELDKISRKLELLEPVKLIAVSKTFPPASIVQLCTHTTQIAFAENYATELVLKAKELTQYHLEWHFIGHLQSNKARDIAKYASWVHSLENERQVIKLNKARNTGQAPLNVLIEVNISHEATKHGLITLDDVIKLANLIGKQDNLILRGLMGMASNTQDLEIIKHQFRQLKIMFNALVDHGFIIDTLSMGMSSDYITAIENGATMIRIGSAIFGSRSN